MAIIGMPCPVFRDPNISCVKPGFHSNAIACVACVAQTKTTRNASVCVGKQPIVVATLSTENSYIGWRLRLLRENFTQQTQAPANMNARSIPVVVGCWHDFQLKSVWRSGWIYEVLFPEYGWEGKVRGQGEDGGKWRDIPVLQTDRSSLQRFFMCRCSLVIALHSLILMLFTP